MGDEDIRIAVLLPLTFICWGWSRYLSVSLLIFYLVDMRYQLVRKAYNKIISHFQRKVAVSAGGMLLKLVNTYFEAQKVNESQPYIQGSCLIIPFAYQGQEYQVALPYHRSWTRRVKFEVHNGGGVHFINFHPCLPMNFTPSQLGIDSLSVIDCRNHIKTTYTGDEIPLLPSQLDGHPPISQRKIDISHLSE